MGIGVVVIALSKNNISDATPQTVCNDKHEIFPKGLRFSLEIACHVHSAIIPNENLTQTTRKWFDIKGSETVIAPQA